LVDDIDNIANKAGDELTSFQSTLSTAPWNTVGYIPSIQRVVFH